MNTSITPATPSTKTDYGAALRARAVEDFPAVFGKSVRPLALGVDAVLKVAWPDVGRCRIKRFLSDHCKSRSYLLAIAAGGPRYYLDGSVDGEVSEDQRAHAHQMLEARQARNLAAYQAAVDANKQRRLERAQAAYDKGIAAHRAELAPGVPAEPPVPLVIIPAASEAPRPARPVLRASSVQVRGPNRQTREVEVVKVAPRKKLAINNRDGAARS